MTGSQSRHMVIYFIQVQGRKLDELYRGIQLWIRRTGNDVHLVSRVSQGLAQIAYIDTLTAAVWITPIPQEADF